MKPSVAPDKVSDDALQWFLRLQDPDCSEAERQAFDAWLAADPRNQREYETLLHTWDRMDLLAAQPFPELERRLGAGDKPTPGRSSARFAPWLGRGAAIAAILVAVIGVAWWWTAFRVTITTYETAKGEQRTVALPDGSTVELNTDTAVTARLSRAARRVTLDRGEAFFSVAHDPGRPFDVKAAGGRIQAIGTEFTVHRQPARVVVAVLDGAVEVGTSPTNGRILSRGERVFYTPEGRLAAVERVEPRRMAAWRRGILVFDGVPLADAIREVNRYWPGRIVLTNPTLGGVKIQGVFNHRNLHEFFTALPDILPVEVVQSPHRVVIRSPRQG